MSSFVRGNIGNIPFGTSTPQMTLPGTPSVGDILVIVAANAGNFTGVPTDTQSNTWNLLAGSPSSFFATYWAISLGGGGAYTVTCHVNSAGSTQIAIGEYVGPASAVLDAANSGYQHLVCTTTATFTAGAGELAVLGTMANNGTSLISGTGVTQRENYGSFLALGDKLSTSSGTNSWNVGTGGCCSSDFYASAILFKTPSTAPKSVLFDAMNE